MRSFGLFVVGGATATGLLLGLSAWRMGDQLWSWLVSRLGVAQSAPQVNVRSIVLQQVRDASELTTAVFTMQAVVPTSQDTSLGGLVVGTTKLLYIAHGEVQAGVDLSQLTPDRVKTSGDRITLQLPPPKILSSKIDVNRSSVYDYDRGFLSLGPDSAPQLQTLAEQKALQTIVTAACTDKLLQRASDRAKFVVTQLLSTAGYKQVTVESPPVAANACDAIATAGGQPSPASATPVPQP